MASRLAAGDEAGARHAQNRAIEFTLLLSLPCVVAFLIVPDLIMRALFVRGAFTRGGRGGRRRDARGLRDRAGAVRADAQRVRRRSWRAATPRRRSRRCSSAVAVNVALKIAADERDYAQVGLAFATSIGAWINFALLRLVRPSRARLIAVDERLKRSAVQARGRRRRARASRCSSATRVLERLLAGAAGVARRDRCSRRSRSSARRLRRRAGAAVRPRVARGLPRPAPRRVP